MSCGASALGLVSEMPSGPGVIGLDLIAEIAAVVPPPVATFLLRSAQDAETPLEQHRACGTTTIQLVDDVPVDELRRLRAHLRGIKLVQVVHVAGPESVEQAVAVAPFVDALLLDSGNPNLAIKELGGTARVHDWRVSRRIRDSVDRPVFLAGGLRASNVAEAIATVAPFGLDLCSSARTEGRLDPEKLRAFFDATLDERAHASSVADAT